MVELYQKLGGEAGLLEIAAKHGKRDTVADYLKGLNEWRAKNPAKRPQWVVDSAATEELLSFITQEGPSFKRTVRAIIGGLRHALRKLGLARLANYGETDIARILSNAHKASLIGTAGVAATPELSMLRREESARSVNLHPAVKPKTGLLDTPMRLAFQKTGAPAVWRGAFRLLEKTANVALDNKVDKAIKTSLIDRYGLLSAIIKSGITRGCYYSAL
jgi:hypothetical protein